MDPVKNFNVGVKGLIENTQGQILLLLEDTSNHSQVMSEYWDLPGGRMHTNETALDTLKREIKEETGIADISNPEFYAGVISNHEIKLKSGEMIGIVIMVYRVKVAQDSKIVLSDENTNFEWVSKQEAAKRLHDKYPPEFTRLLAK